MQPLLTLLQKHSTNRDAAILAFQDLLEKAVKEVNLTFTPRRLLKLHRKVELLPIDTRQLSSYRTRLGTMLEYAVSTAVQKLLDEEKTGILMSFAVAHEYPDFYLRELASGKILARIEMKAVDADSDEQAARFDVPTNMIKADFDYVFFIAWQWIDIILDNKDFGEHPHIFSCLSIPATEIVKERDKRLAMVGGKIVKGEVFVPSTKQPGKLVLDPGNYGKFKRIIHSSRNYDDLSEQMKRFKNFYDGVYQRSPRGIKAAKRKTS